MIRCKEELLKTKVHFKQLASIELNDSQDPEKLADVKERLQQMEHLKSKLKLQLTMCASGLIMTTTIYFLIWYNSECWALPFQESPCMQPGSLPLTSTNQSTLAEAVDEFILSLTSQIIKVNDSSLMNDQAERHRFFNIVKTEIELIEELIHRQSMDLVGFSALIRDDHKFKFLTELGISNQYFLLFNFATFIWLFILIIDVIVYGNISNINKKEMTSTEENENSQNGRLKQLNRQISVLSTTTMICIAAEITLLSVFTAGHNFYDSASRQDNVVGASNLQMAILVPESPPSLYMLYKLRKRNDS